MAKIKIQKKDIWIDMTPMSDVMTLLLCFFMLTSTFLTPEPVSVTAPNSVSELKIPEQDVLNILVTPEGRVYCGTENKNNMQAMLDAMTDKFGIQLNSEQIKHFREDAMVGASMSQLAAYLSLEQEKMAEEVQKLGLWSVPACLSSLPTCLLSRRKWQKKSRSSACRSIVSRTKTAQRARANSRSGSLRPAMRTLTSNSPSSATLRLHMEPSRN